MTIGKSSSSITTIMVMGVNGFVGHHLAKELKQNDCRIIGVGNTPELEPELESLVEKYIVCDLANMAEVATIDFTGVNAVINLAGFASVSASFDNASEYMRVNTKVHTNVCEVLKANDLAHIRVVAVSTGAVYDSSQPMPLTEVSKTITKGSPYAQSKLAMEKALKAYSGDGMDIIIARPFNHTGPGQRPGFLIPDLIAQLAGADGKNRQIQVGNLKTRRDYTDVRDVARAYRLLALAPKSSLSSGLYNICSGVSTSGEEILDLIINKLGLANKVTVVVDKTRIRPDDPADIFGSSRLIFKDAGWKPTIEIEKTIADAVSKT
jgi:GDP-4-dehydro-6-deoxy-D-mannose reductase